MINLIKSNTRYFAYFLEYQLLLLDDNVDEESK